MLFRKYNDKGYQGIVVNVRIVCFEKYDFFKTNNDFNNPFYKCYKRKINIHNVDFRLARYRDRYELSNVSCG